MHSSSAHSFIWRCFHRSSARTGSGSTTRATGCFRSALSPKGKTFCAILCAAHRFRDSCLTCPKDILSLIRKAAASSAAIQKPSRVWPPCLTASEAFRLSAPPCCSSPFCAFFSYRLSHGSASFQVRRPPAPSC